MGRLKVVEDSRSTIADDTWTVINSCCYIAKEDEKFLDPVKAVCDFFGVETNEDQFRYIFKLLPLQYLALRYGLLGEKMGYIGNGPAEQIVYKMNEVGLKIFALHGLSVSW